MPKDHTASPTVGLGSLMSTCVVDAKENRNVATVDIPNASIQIDLTSETIVMKIKGELVGILIEIDLNAHKDYIVYENNVPVLCLEALKALHGMSHGSSLFHGKFVEDLKSYGFELNPHDPCAANEMVDGEQLTVCWHVDDLKASHEDSEVTDDFCSMD